LLTNHNAEERIVYANAGGDGSLMWTIKSFHEQGIDADEIAYATLPFGTANDLPWNFGWGKAPSWWLLNDMHYVIEEIMDAEEVLFNVWEIVIETREEGGMI